MMEPMNAVLWHLEASIIKFDIINITIKKERLPSYAKCFILKMQCNSWRYQMTDKKCGCRKTTSKETKTKECSFPEKELKAWLKNKKQWNHEEWLGLLKKLEKKGYSEWTDCEECRCKIGQFLESERTKS